MRSDFRIGDWIVRPRRECIQRGDEYVHIHPRPMEVLQRLAAADGEVVTRDELFTDCWPDVQVTDDALTQCIVELRKAFGDSARKQRVIRTVPKVGFCLVLPVSELDRDAGRVPGKWAIAAIGALVITAALLTFSGTERSGDSFPGNPPTGERASIVVLPFINMSADPEQDYFSDGITEELINLLSRSPDLKVISRTSAFSFKGQRSDLPSIARQLDVSHVLEGSVRSSEGQIRIAAQLIDARADTQVWSRTWDRTFGEVFAVQDEIAQQVAQGIRVSLLGQSARSARVAPEAYRLYLLGQHYLNSYDFPKARTYLQQALALEPQYARAHVAMASWYGGKTFFGDFSPREGYARIRGQLALAFGADSELAVIHRPIAEMHFYFDWNWEKAEAAFRRAMKALPSDAHTLQLYTWYLLAMGRIDEAGATIERSLELEPLAPSVYLTASNVHYFSNRHEQAIALCRTALDIAPDHPLALSQIGWSQLQMERPLEAVTSMERAVQRSPHNMQLLWMLGHAYGVAGEDAKARAVLNEMRALADERYVMPFGFALVHTGLGQTELALEWLEKAHAERNGWMVYLAVEPRLDPLRKEPRFRALMDAMQFPTG